jgi:hypothetical protein
VAWSCNLHEAALHSKTKLCGLVSQRRGAKFRLPARRAAGNIRTTNFKMRKLLPISLLPLLLCAWPCFAQNQDYLPLTRTETSRRFPVKLLGETGGGRPGHFGTGSDGAAAPTTISIGPSGASFEMDEEGHAVIKGKDRGGAAWRVRLGNLGTGYGARLYTADLDLDGARDLWCWTLPKGAR